MAITLPRLDDFLPGIDTAPWPSPIVPPKPRVSAYAALTPKEKAEVDREVAFSDKQDELLLRPRGALGEISTGLQRGFMSELPRMVGQALKSTGKPGDRLHRAGSSAVDFADEQNLKYAQDLNEGAHGAFVSTLAEGASMVGPSLAPMAALPLLATAGVPAAAGLAVAGAAGAGLFGASQYQDTYEKAIKAGKTPEEAHSLGLKTGVIEGVGESLGTIAGAKFISKAGKLLRSNTPRVLGRKYEIDDALGGMRNPNFMRQFGKEFAENTAVQVGTEMGQGYGEAAVEKNAGIDTHDPWHAATASIGPTMALSVFLAPFGAFATRSAMRSNQAALKVVDDPYASLADTNRATGALAPQLTPLVGKEEAQAWRLERLAAANESDKAFEKINQEEGWWQQQQEQMQVDAFANQKPPAIPSPSPDQILGRDVGAYPHYRSDAEAERAWAGLDTGAVLTAQQRKQQEQAHGPAVAAIIGDPNAAVATPEVIPTFAEFVAEAKKARTGPLGVGGSVTEAGLRQAYVRMVQDRTAAMERQQQGETPAEAAQPQLDLGHPSPGLAEQAPAKAPEAPAQTAMAAALERVGGKAAIQTQAAVAERAQQLSESTQEERAADEPRLAGVAERTRRVEAANRLADDAMQGKIDGNTPVAVEDLVRVAHVATANAGLPFRGQVKSKVEAAVRSVTGAKLWVNQLAKLRDARDAMKENSPSRDAMSAVIEHLTSRTPTLPVAPAAQSTKEKADGTPPVVPQKEITGTSFQDPLDAGGQGNAETQLNDEGTPARKGQALLTTAAPGVVEANPPPFAAEAPPVAAPVTSTEPVKSKGHVAFVGDREYYKDAKGELHVAPRDNVIDLDTGYRIGRFEAPAHMADAMVARAQSDARLAAAKEGEKSAPAVEEVSRVPGNSETPLPPLVATATGEVTDRPVAWGEFSQTAPDGTVTYDTPNFKPMLKQNAAKAAARKSRSLMRSILRLADLVPAEYQRTTDEANKFYFEHYEYDPKMDRGESSNLTWTLDLRRALALSQGRNIEGVSIKWNAREKVDSVKDRANAIDALEWLKNYSPEDYQKGLGNYDHTNPTEGDSRIAQINRVYDKNAAMLEARATALKEILARYVDAYRYRVAGERGIKPESVKIDKAQMAELERLSKLDPGVEYANVESTNREYSPSLARDIERGSLNAALERIKRNGSSSWIRTIAEHLQRMNLDTRLVLSNTIGLGPVDFETGEHLRAYGRYNHAKNRIRIFLGGENAYTVVHEAVHAATVGQLAFAKAASRIPEHLRTPEMHAAAAHLVELRGLMAGLSKLDTSNQYAFTNEEEFVAEALSNAKFQQWLSRQVFEEGNGWRARTGWGRFIDWLRSLIGMSPLHRDALEAATTTGTLFMRSSRYGSYAGESFDTSVQGAFAQTDGVVSALVSKWAAFAASNRNIGNMPQRGRQALMTLSTTFNLSEMIDRIPLLRPMVEGVTRLMAADTTKTLLRQSKQMEFARVLKPLDMIMSRLSSAGERELNHKLMELGGEASRLNIDLNKNFDENLKAHKGLDPSLRGRWNQIHADYMRLSPAVRTAFENTVRVLRKNYIQQTSTTLARNLQAYRDKHSELVNPAIRLLDIMDKSLENGTNTQPGYFFDAYSANLSTRLDAVFTKIREATKGEKDSHIAQETALIESLYRAAVKNPYQHLGRSGDFFVQFDVAKGDAAWSAVNAAFAAQGKVIGMPLSQRVFMRFETAGARNQAVETAKSLGAHVVPESTQSGTLANTESLYNLSKGLAPALGRVIRNIGDAFPGEDRKAVREFLQREIFDLLPDTAPQKALAQRKSSGIAGYDADFRRNFTKRAEGMSVMLSNAYTMDKYDAAFEMLKDEANKLRSAGNPHASDVAQEVLTELGTRFANSLNPVDSPLIDRAKALGYNFYLALSPAFILTNLMQPYHLALPYLGGRFGFVTSAKEMGRSSKKAFTLMQGAIAAGWEEGKKLGGTSGALHGVLDLTLRLQSSGLTVGERDMITRLLASGQLDTTQSHELGQLASGDSRGWATTMKILSTGSHYSEVLNRLTVALATYNLETSRGKHKGSDIGHEFAAQRSIKAVRETQYDYSDHNTARALSRHGVVGKVTPLLVSFQNYAFQTMELLFRMSYDSVSRVPEGATAQQAADIRAEAVIARKQLAGVMATTSLIAGTLGLPLASVVARMADALLGSDDDPSDIKTAYRGWLAEVFGKDVAEAIARGIPRSVLGFDTSNRAGLADLLPGSRFFTDRRSIKDKLESGAFNLLGPAVSAGQDALVGMDKISDGYVMDGLVQMLPLALRGPVKAVQISQQGFTSSTGNKLPLEVTPWALVVQSAGFTPSVKAEQSEVNFRFRQMEGLMKQRKSVLSNQFYRAAEKGEDTTAALKRIIEFNAAHPQFRVDVGAGLAARAKERAVADITGSDIATLPRYLPLLDKYSFANTR